MGKKERKWLFGFSLEAAEINKDPMGAGGGVSTTQTKSSESSVALTVQSHRRPDRTVQAGGGTMRPRVML